MKNSTSIKENKQIFNFTQQEKYWRFIKFTFWLIEWKVLIRQLRSRPTDLSNRDDRPI